MLARRLQTTSLSRFPIRPFSALPFLLEKSFPPRTPINETEITESFLKGTGPGGQKINKTSSAVQLKHLPTGLVVKCQETRSREQNRKLARRLLQDRLEEREKGSEARTAVKAERARGKKASAEKKRRRKYRRLEEEKAMGTAESEGRGDAREDDGEGHQHSAEEGSQQHDTERHTPP